MSTRYVVGIDDSRPAQAARTWAEAHARRTGVECVFVHVEQARAAVAEPSGRPFGVVAHTVAGAVPEALAGWVRPDDVLVIGTGKTGFIHGRVFGSLGIQITTLAPCSVAVIPDVDVRFRSGVVAGIDRYETAAAVASTAAAEATIHGTGLRLVQSDPAIARRTGKGSPLPVSVAETIVRRGWPDLDVRMRLVARPAAEALLDAARNAMLLVLGPGAPERRVVPGRVLHDVLVNANAPVLVTRPASRARPSRA